MSSAGHDVSVFVRLPTLPQVWPSAAAAAAGRSPAASAAGGGAGADEVGFCGSTHGLLLTLLLLLR